MVHQPPKTILRAPKIFQAPRDERDQITLPKILKIASILLIIFLGLLYLFIFSPVFKIKSIEIVGSPSDEVKSVFDNLKGTNIFLFSSSDLEKKVIEREKKYLSVEIFRGLPDTVRVKFQDREAKIIWMTNDQKYLVDKDAILFQEAPENINLPVVVDEKDLTVEIPAQIASSGFVEFIKSANTELSNLNINVTKFNINETTFQTEAETESGIRIIFDTLRPLSEQIEAFKKVWEKDKDKITDYIDLRVEGWVYFK